MLRSASLLLALFACAPLAAQTTTPSVAAPAAARPAPQVFVSFPPALVVRIDGRPTLGPVPGHPKVARVTNASVVILFADRPNTEPVGDRLMHEAYYMKVNGLWMTATWLIGPWKPARDLVPFLRRELDKIADELGQQGVRVGVETSPAPPGAIPSVYVSEVPAQLVLFDGPPRYAPSRAPASRARSTRTTTCCSTAARGPSTSRPSACGSPVAALDGPWTVVPEGALPPEVARIPVRPPAARGS